MQASVQFKEPELGPRNADWLPAQDPNRPPGKDGRWNQASTFTPSSDFIASTAQAHKDRDIGRSDNNNPVLETDNTGESVTNDLGNPRKLNRDQLWDQGRTSITCSQVPQKFRYVTAPRISGNGCKEDARVRRIG